MPGGGPFFERYGLLYRSLEDLEDFSDQLAQVQPLIAELERGGTIADLVGLVRGGLDQVGKAGPGPEDWSAVLDRIGSATVEVYDEYPLSVSWEDLLLRGSALEVSTRRVIVVEPVLDFDSLLAAGGAIAEIREAAQELGLTPERGVRVRITGNPALNYEEMLGMAWDVGWTGLLSFAGVALVLWLAFRSKRLVTAALITLVVGLVWTTAFAAAAVGHINLISICFTVLFIGLGVDFAIHHGMNYLELRRRGDDHAAALRGATESCGTSLVLCTLTTTIGFYAFVPTDYRGVAELGLIAGTGMIVILLQTLTLLPALMTLGLQPSDTERLRAARRRHIPGAAWLHAHPRGVLVVSGLLALGSLALVPRLRFDPNVVRMRNSETESVEAFNELLADRDIASPWTIDWIAPDLEAAVAKAQEVRELDVVKRALTLADFVPDDQPEKLEILADLELMLDADAPRGGDRIARERRGAGRGAARAARFPRQIDDRRQALAPARQHPAPAPPARRIPRPRRPRARPRRGVGAARADPARAPPAADRDACAGRSPRGRSRSRRFRTRSCGACGRRTAAPASRSSPARTWRTRARSPGFPTPCASSSPMPPGWRSIWWSSRAPPWARCARLSSSR